MLCYGGTYCVIFPTDISFPCGNNIVVIKTLTNSQCTLAWLPCMTTSASNGLIYLVKNRRPTTMSCHWEAEWPDLIGRRKCQAKQMAGGRTRVQVIPSYLAHASLSQPDSVAGAVGIKTLVWPLIQLCTCMHTYSHVYMHT